MSAITWTLLFSKVTGRFMIFLWGKILLVYDYNVYVLNHTEHMKYFVFEFWLIRVLVVQINDGSQMVWFQDAFVVGVCCLDAGCRLMATVFHVRDSQQLLSLLILWPWTWVVMIATNNCALSHEEELFLNDDTCGFLIATVKGLKTSTMLWLMQASCNWWSTRCHMNICLQNQQSILIYYPHIFADT